MAKKENQPQTVFGGDLAILNGLGGSKDEGKAYATFIMGSIIPDLEGETLTVRVRKYSNSLTLVTVLHQCTSHAVHLRHHHPHRRISPNGSRSQGLNKFDGQITQGIGPWNKFAKSRYSSANEVCQVGSA